MGRTGKQPDGAAKAREAKLCAVWRAEGRDEAGTPVRDGLGDLLGGDREAPGVSLCRGFECEIVRRGFERAARRIALGDGALWIWNVVTEHLPDADQIATSSTSSST